jgi:probable phosphoglycerate mutase
VTTVLACCFDLNSSPEMLHLVRHGQSTANAQSLLAGQLDVELTELGRAQAKAAGELLADAVEVRSSSLSRAKDTAKLALPHLRLSVDDRFIEVDYGTFDGMALAEIPREFWSLWRNDPHFTPEGGESLAAVRQRVGAALEELFDRDGAGARQRDGSLVIVSHVSPIKAAVAWVLGAQDDAVWKMHLSNASVTSIAMGPHGPVLHAYNTVRGEVNS